MVALLVALMVTMAAQADPPEYLYFEKDCSSDPCIIQDATLPILNGGTVAYLGPVERENPHGFYHISSEVLLSSADGLHTVTGHFRWVGDHGYFTLRRGTGDLVGLHARGLIEWKEGTIYSLTGTYHFEP